MPSGSPRSKRISAASDWTVVIRREEWNMRTVLKGAILAVLALASASALAATAYVSNEKSNTISIVDLDRLEVTRTVRVGARPRGIALSKDKRLLYICASDDHRVEVLDLEKLEV